MKILNSGSLPKHLCIFIGAAVQWTCVTTPLSSQLSNYTLRQKEWKVVCDKANFAIQLTHFISLKEHFTHQTAFTLVAYQSQNKAYQYAEIVHMALNNLRHGFGACTKSEILRMSVYLFFSEKKIFLNDHDFSSFLIFTLVYRMTRCYIHLF